MENRFENLYGYIQRSLVKNIRNELSGDESLTIGVLIFHALSESFYYESTVKNVLIKPKDIKSLFTEKEIWDFKLMHILGRYMTQSRIKEYIKELLENNDKLAKNNASFYDIVYDEYKEFKQEWKDWLEVLDFEKFRNTYNSEDEQLKEELNRIFYFANYLLTIIRFEAIKKFNPDTIIFTEMIYRNIINQVNPDMNELFEIKNGELHPSKKPIDWRINADSQISFAELALVLEICFKQPLNISDKIEAINDLIENEPERLNPEERKYPLTAMAKPLFYNGEFQGIIYITRNVENGYFSEEDFNKFRDCINNFQIESIIYSSRFYTSRIFIEKISDKDVRYNIHPLIKVLSLQHLFSSALLGLAVVSDSSIYIRYKDHWNLPMKSIDIQSYHKFKELVMNCGMISLDMEMKEKLYSWIEVPDHVEVNFNKQLKNILGYKEDVYVKSFICMRFNINDLPCYYYIFNFNHIELLEDSESNNAIRQSYALRAYNSINKLIDAFFAAKKLYDIQNNLLAEIENNLIHDLKKFLGSNLLKQIREIAELNKVSQIKKQLTGVMQDIDNTIDRFREYLLLLSEQMNEQDIVTLNKRELLLICANITEEFKTFKKVKFLIEADEKLESIHTHKMTLRKILGELVSNAIKQYSTPEGSLVPRKEIRIKICNTAVNFQKDSLEFTVYNTGTHIPESIMMIAGTQQIHNGSNRSTGLGLKIVNTYLKRINPSLIVREQAFIINNDPNGVGISFTLSNNLKSK